MTDQDFLFATMAMAKYCTNVIAEYLPSPLSLLLPPLSSLPLSLPFSYSYYPVPRSQCTLVIGCT